MHEKVKRYCNRPRITLIKASRAEPIKATQPGSDHFNFTPSLAANYCVCVTPKRFLSCLCSAQHKLNQITQAMTEPFSSMSKKKPTTEKNMYILIKHSGCLSSETQHTWHCLRCKQTWKHDQDGISLAVICEPSSSVLCRWKCELQQKVEEPNRRQHVM